MRSVFLLPMFLLAICFLSRAQEVAIDVPTGKLPSCYMSHLDTENGLPGLTVNSLLRHASPFINLNRRQGKTVNAWKLRHQKISAAIRNAPDARPHFLLKSRKYKLSTHATMPAEDGATFDALLSQANLQY